MEYSASDLIAIVKQATEPINENITLLRSNFAEVVIGLMKKDDDQQAEIDSLEHRFSGNESLLEEICERIKTIETSMISLVSSIPPAVKVDMLSSEIGELGKEIKEIKRHLPFIKAMRWVVGILVALAITTIWALITGVQNLVNVIP